MKGREKLALELEGIPAGPTGTSWKKSVFENQLFGIKENIDPKMKMSYLPEFLAQPKILRHKISPWSDLSFETIPEKIGPRTNEIWPSRSSKKAKNQPRKMDSKSEKWKSRNFCLTEFDGFPVSKRAECPLPGQNWTENLPSSLLVPCGPHGTPYLGRRYT